METDHVASSSNPVVPGQGFASQSFDALFADGVVSLDERGVIRGWDDGARRILGYAAAEVVGRPIASVIPGLDVTACVGPTAGTSPVDRTQVGLRRDGGRTLLGTALRPFTAADGERFVTCVIRDVAEGRRVAGELRESEETFRATFELAAVGIAHVTLDGSFLRVNQMFCAITGYGRDELTRMTFQDITHPDDLGLDLQNLSRLHSGEIATYTMDKRYITKEASLVWVSLTVSLVRDANGSPKLYIAVAQDVSARKRAEGNLSRLRDELEDRVSERTRSLEEEIARRRRVQETLQRKEAELRLITRIVPASILYIDHDLRFRFCNELYTRWLRTPQDRIIGRPVREVQGEAFHALVAEEASTVLRTGEPVTFERMLTFPDAERCVLCHLLPDKDDDGAVRGCVILATDVTAQRSLQEELTRAKEAAVAANQAKSTFLATMSHEIRTPIGVILGYAEELMKPSLSDEQRVRLAETVHRNGANLLAIVNDVLDISKVEVGKLDIEKSRFSLPTFMDDVVTQLGIKAAEKGLRLSWDIDGAIPATVETDAARLRQILFNLIGNAIKFTEEGQVAVHVSLARDGDGASLRFAVTDTGIGIDAKAQERLFQPFTQADSSVARKHGGTGLGLSLSRQMARLLGGDVVLRESRAGEGSTFVARVDPGALEGVSFVTAIDAEGIKRQRAESGRLRRAMRVDLSHMRILVAEDFEDNQALLRAMLEDAAARVDVADNGSQAFAMAMASDYDAILMDMQMPVRDGYWATQELRRHGYAKPIIALTAHAMVGEKEKCLGIGCTEFLTKPVDRVSLLQTLKDAVGSAGTGPGAMPAAPHAPASREAGTRPLRSLYADKPFVARVLPVFVAKLPGKVQTLEAMCEAGDTEGIRRLAHQLKGAGGSYGFPDVTRCARDIEDDAACPASVTRHVAELKDLCARIAAGAAEP